MYVIFTAIFPTYYDGPKEIFDKIIEWWRDTEQMEHSRMDYWKRVETEKPIRELL